jgi:hypothetical protein
MEDLRYPIGKYQPQPFSDELKEQWLNDIKFLPNAVESAILNLSEEQLKTAYREGGWTVHQLVHHIADSHMNAFIRCKLAYTEKDPVIKTYEEKEWVKTPDVQNVPVNISITLLFSLHARWHEFLSNLSEAEYQRAVFHPEHKTLISLWNLLGLYAWHGRHHVAHINNLRNRMNW